MERSSHVKERLFESAKRLHRYLLANHWDGGALKGPAPGVRWNFRIWRFVRAYTSFLQWKDQCVCYQGQGYWILANWLLLGLTKDDHFGDVALASSRFVLETQRQDGSWPNPLPERKHLVATIEGVWASAGLLATYERTGDTSCLEGALAWHRFMTERIGYQEHGADGAAINYFDVPRGKVPNTSTAALWFLSELAKASGEARHLEPSSRMLAFLADVQTSKGEMPYEIPGPTCKRRMPHYQCFQYNAFQLADLYHLWKNTRIDEARSIAKGIASFLAGGVTPGGAPKHHCGADRPSVTYHADSIGYALSCASRWGLGDYANSSQNAYAWALGRQRSDGSFPFSTGDYWILGDGRSYPSTLAMTLFHLASEVE